MTSLSSDSLSPLGAKGSVVNNNPPLFSKGISEFIVSTDLRSVELTIIQSHFSGSIGLSEVVPDNAHALVSAAIITGLPTIMSVQSPAFDDPSKRLIITAKREPSSTMV